MLLTIPKELLPALLSAVQDPPNINIACPSGQVLTGISNNNPVCTTVNGSGTASIAWVTPPNESIVNDGDTGEVFAFSISPVQACKDAGYSLPSGICRVKGNPSMLGGVTDDGYLYGSTVTPESWYPFGKVRTICGSMATLSGVSYEPFYFGAFDIACIR